jgi:hypothetical protein
VRDGDRQQQLTLGDGRASCAVSEANTRIIIIIITVIITITITNSTSSISSSRSSSSVVPDVHAAMRHGQLLRTAVVGCTAAAAPAACCRQSRCPLATFTGTRGAGSGVAGLAGCRAVLQGLPLNFAEEFIHIAAAAAAAAVLL